eukprot:TRINITY_DN3637_c0_g1_i8.p1 TRINITY_DN3637_c0_g1~~TRINITY_DN3637_c0_g1_i8.p1  ORF type:complete len:254 (+),score=66.70 TRINITY_DN3637_c0_g1_i8:156-917(+)
MTQEEGDQEQPQQQQENGTDAMVEDAQVNERLTPKQEKHIIKEIDQACTLHEGDTWYILEMRWWKQWKGYVKYDDRYDFDEDSQFSSWNPYPRPSQIDNEELVDSELNLRKNMVESIDFILLPSEIWMKLSGWYGGGPPLPRKVITYGYGKNLMVETKPLTLKVVRSTKLNEIHTVRYSKATPVLTLKNECCKMMSINPEQVRVWDFHTGQKFKLLTNENDRLDESQIIDEQMILIEEKLASGEWPKDPTANR